MCDGYGLYYNDRPCFSGLVTRRMEVTASDIEFLAAGGAAAHERLVSEGVPTLARDDRIWVESNAGGLHAALVGGRLGG